MRPGYGSKKKAKKFKEIKPKAAAAVSADGEVEMADAAPAASTAAAANGPTPAAPQTTPDDGGGGAAAAAAIAYAAAVAKQSAPGGGTAKERLRAKLQIKRALRVKNLKPKKKKGKGR